MTKKVPDKQIRCCVCSGYGRVWVGRKVTSSPQSGQESYCPLCDGKGVLIYKARG